MISKVFVLTALCALMLSQTVLGDEVRQRELSREFDGESVESLELMNLAGRVLLEGHSASQVQVRAVIHSMEYKDLSAEEVSGLVSVQMEMDGDRLMLKSVYPLDDYKHYRYQPEKAGFFSNSNNNVRYQGRKVKVSSGRRSKGLPVWVDYHVRVPEGVACDLHMPVGNVKLDAVSGSCAVECGSGDIHAKAQRGMLALDTGSGDVTVSDMVGELRIDTGSGDVSVGDLRGDFEVDTGSGDIQLRNAAGEVLGADTGSGDVDLEDVDYPRLRVDTGSGDVNVASPESHVERWELDTGSGDVTLAFDEDKASFHLKVSTGSGDVDCDLDGAKLDIRDDEIRALTVGEGEGRISVDTGSGDLAIEES